MMIWNHRWNDGTMEEGGRKSGGVVVIRNDLVFVVV